MMAYLALSPASLAAPVSDAPASDAPALASDASALASDAPEVAPAPAEVLALESDPPDLLSFAADEDEVDEDA